MRVLFTIMPAPAHLYPILPVARALQSAGHEVAVASYPEAVGAITGAGLTAIPAGGELDIAELVRTYGADTDLRDVIGPLMTDASEEVLQDLLQAYVMGPYGLHYPHPAAGPAEKADRSAMDRLTEVARAWRPDLMLWDPLCFHAPVAARACGAAHARLLFGIDYFGWIRARYREQLGPGEAGTGADLMAERMRPTLERYGLDFTEETLTGHWTIDPMPDQMRLPTGLRRVPVRRVPAAQASVLPDWLLEEPRRPRVCLTLGVSTRRFFAGAAGVIPIDDLLDAMADLDVEVIATLTANQLGEGRQVPDNVRLFDFVPLDQLLPSCAAVVHHGGGGTFAAAVASRVPQLIAPRALGDSTELAAHVEARGAGLTIGLDDFSADAFRAQLVRLLTESSFQQGAMSLHEDMLAAPSPHAIVSTLEQLTALHRG
ncbi:activator-dependent family glycosyltransferase [Streptomyces sp. 21So2-11]|uniref:activator-dependent family glycosyltransferase n=1 Tax=Streptomyces sp. 21So2-11 TaxID=3144408 RepID=UPI00321B1EE1